MPTRNEIIEAGARAIHESQCCPLDANSECDLSDAPVSLVETALSAMLPLIKAQMVAEVLADLVYDDAGELNAFNSGQEYTARLIEGYEPAP